MVVVLFIQFKGGACVCCLFECLVVIRHWDGCRIDYVGYRLVGQRVYERSETRIVRCKDKCFNFWLKVVAWFLVDRRVDIRKRKEKEVCLV